MEAFVTGLEEIMLATATVFLHGLILYMQTKNSIFFVLGETRASFP
jgi:hypothetical protein